MSTTSTTAQATDVLTTDLTCGAAQFESSSEPGGHSALGGLVVGSVTQRLLHVAPCPVLAMPQITPPAAELRDLEAARQVA
jgi:hypothetical protein